MGRAAARAAHSGNAPCGGRNPAFDKDKTIAKFFQGPGPKNGQRLAVTRQSPVASPGTLPQAGEEGGLRTAKNARGFLARKRAAAMASTAFSGD